MAALKWISARDAPVEIPRQVYDHKLYYVNREYHVDPSAMEAVCIPGGYANASIVYIFYPDSRLDHRILMIMRRENNKRKLFVVFFAFDLLI